MYPNLKIRTLLPALMLLFGVSTAAADALQNVIETNGRKIEESAKSQLKIDKSFEQTNQLLDEYRSINRQIEALQFYTRQLGEQIENQKLTIANVEASMSQISIIERQLPSLMQQMIERLDQFVKLDAPFHRQERRQRIEQLKSNLILAELSLAEKFRQLLESYKIEIEYGRKIDSYEDTIELDGQARKVNMLRVGRIALLYQTRDRLRSGFWDRNSRQWQTLDNDEYRNAIVKGIRIARNQSTIDLLQMPIANVEITP